MNNPTYSFLHLLMRLFVGRRIRIGGGLLLLALSVSSGWAQNFSAALSSNQTFIRPDPGSVVCGEAYGTFTSVSSGSTVYSYATQSFTVTTAGNYSITATSSTASDPMLFVYNGSFNPSNPTANFKVGDDDSGGTNYLPSISGCGNYFSVGTYIIVVSTYNNAATLGTVNFTISGGGSVAVLPTVTTNTASSVTTASAVLGGNISASGGATVTARGVAWGTSSNPTSGTAMGSGTGAFSATITGLNPGTTYYARAYADNLVGRAYGAQVTFTAAKLDQTITFSEMASPQTYGDAAFTLGATASSGLPVAYASSSTSVATVTGNLVTIVGAGSVTITVSQPGSTTYNAASSVDRTFVVNPKELTISGLSAEDKIFDDTPAATASGTAELVGVIEGDAVTLSGSPIFTFVQKEVGNDISVFITGYTLSGADASNYSLILPTLSASIFPGSPSTLEVLQQPVQTVAGVALADPSVLARDVFGNPVAVGFPISVSLTGGSFAVGSTPTALTDASGIATFSNLVIEPAGEDYELHFEYLPPVE